MNIQTRLKYLRPLGIQFEGCRRLLYAGFTFTLLALIVSPLMACQERPVATLEAEANPKVDLVALQMKYDKLLSEWREAIKEYRSAGASFFYSPRDEAKKWRDAAQAAIIKGIRKLEALKPVAIELYENMESPDEDLRRLIGKIFADLYNRGRYQDAYDLGTLISKRNPDVEEVAFLKGRAAVMLNKFDEAVETMDKYSSLVADLDSKEQMLFGNADLLSEYYQRELEQRKIDETANLPRVQLKTTKGTIVLELFEDQAPQTVGNFVSLVEARYYDGKIFHRVINHFMAQTGGFSEDRRPHSVNYKIYDECDREDFRRHFRGSVSMAKEMEPDTGNTEFFINFIPTPALDGDHTVFGRVISGWEALDAINRTFEYNEDGESKEIKNALADKIITARVIRKRDHEYRPTPVKRR